MSSPNPNSSAEKRALWEVRQRYHLATPSATPEKETAPRPAPAPTVATSPRRPRRSPRRWLRRSAFALILLLLAGGGIFGYKILAASNRISTTDRSLIGQLSDLLFSQNKALAGETDDRINILLLAVGGEGHQGENLADTIMIASLRPSNGQVALLSIPRDLYVQVPDEQYYTKINAIHAYGESKQKGDGPIVLKQLVEQITGQPIHYYARIDFTAFKQVVDAVGGIDITIANSFYDYWHKISFPAGREKMNGERALAYVRARYIEGPEGGDFKRAARQQQVLMALREKTFSANTALDFNALSGILDAVADNIRTDMELWEMKRFYEFARQIDRNKMHSAVLTTGSRGVLVGTTETLGGAPASVLKTRTGDFSEIQKIAADIFNSQPTPPLTASSDETTPPPLPETAATPTPSPTAMPIPDDLTVEVRNGTTINGLAKRIGEQMTKAGYRITATANASTREASTTYVYYASEEHEAAAEAVAKLLNAKTKSSLPAEETVTKASLLVILGSDANQ